MTATVASLGFLPMAISQEQERSTETFGNSSDWRFGNRYIPYTICAADAVYYF
jgi:hypothetical protein